MPFLSWQIQISWGNEACLSVLGDFFNIHLYSGIQHSWKFWKHIVRSESKIYVCECYFRLNSSKFRMMTLHWNAFDSFRIDSNYVFNSTAKRGRHSPLKTFSNIIIRKVVKSILINSLLSLRSEFREICIHVWHNLLTIVTWSYDIKACIVLHFRL